SAACTWRSAPRSSVDTRPSIGGPTPPPYPKELHQVDIRVSCNTYCEPTAHSRYAGFCTDRLVRLEHLRGHALTGGDRTVDPAVPLVRGFGAREVDAPHGHAQRRTDARHDPGRIVGHVAPARPLLSRPVVVTVEGERRCLRAEPLHDRLDKDRLARLAVHVAK